MREPPRGERVSVDAEVPQVVDAGILAERHVEPSLLVEATETVVPGAVEVVEETRRFRRSFLSFVEQRIEPGATAIEGQPLISHREINLQTTLNPPVEVNQMGVGIIEQRALRGQT